MAINRAPFNALVDDDGSNTLGTPWNKAAIAGVLLDPIDAALGPNLHCSLFATASTSVPSGVVTPLVFQAAYYDPAGLWNAGAPTRVTIPPGGGGYYLLAGQAFWHPNAIGARALILRTNLGNITWTQFFPGVADFFAPATAIGHRLNPGDYVELAVWQSAGAAVPCGNTGLDQNNRLTVDLLAPL